MNLVKAAELLKNAPEDTLKKYLANPNGEFPEYLVASEIERRRDMRQRYANELEGKPPKTSIIQELLQRDNVALRQPQQPQQMPPEAMGLGAVPPPPGMQLSQAPIMDAAQQPQQFYGGGAVAFADGGGIGDAADAFNEYLRPSAFSNEHGYRVGVSPSIPMGEGSIDVNASAIGHPGYSGYQGRVGASYPVGEGRISAGLSGLADKYAQKISGYDVGYSDDKNRLMANISPTPQGAAYGVNYGRQLDRDASINAALMRDPRGHMSGNLNYVHRFDGGGAVAFARGGVSSPYTVNEADYQPNMSLIQQQDVPEAISLEDAQRQAQNALGPSAVSGYQDVLTKRRAELEANKKNYLPDFLIRAGLGMATSKLGPLAAAAEGATIAFKAHQQSKEADEQAAQNLTDAEFKFKQAERAEKSGLFGLSRQLYNDAYARHNTAVDNNRAAEQLRITAASHLNDARYRAASLGLDEEKVKVLMANAGSEAALHKAQIENYQENRELRRKALQLRGQPKPFTTKDAMAADIAIRTKDPGYAALERNLRKQAKENPAIEPLIQGHLDNYVRDRMKQYQPTYTYADLVGSGEQ